MLEKPKTDVKLLLAEITDVKGDFDEDSERKQLEKKASIFLESTQMKRMLADIYIKGHSGDISHGNEQVAGNWRKGNLC